MKQLPAHKWVVAVGALVLTLAIGAVAWAATGTPGIGSGGGNRSPGDCAGCLVGDQGAEDGRAEAAGSWGMGRGGRMMPGLGGGEERSGRLQECLERWRERGRALLGQMREKMTAEDQASLDSLLRQVEAQREVVRKAFEPLRGIREQIRDLIDKYLPVDMAPAGETGGDTAL